MYSIYRNIILRVWVTAICLVIITGVTSAYAQGNASVQVINIPGGGEIILTVRNKSDGQPSPEGIITWSNVQAGLTGWKIADQYIEITRHGLPPLWGMMTYTDNKSASAEPRFTGSGNPAGLIKTTNPSITLPVVWRITDKSPTEYQTTKYPNPDDNPDNPYNLANLQERADHKGMENYLWHFIKDKNTPDDPKTTDDESFPGLDDGYERYDYVTLWNQSGIAWNEGGRAHNPKKAYLYLGTKFTMAAVNVEYKTSTLTVEAYQGISPFPIYLYKDAPMTEWPNEQGATLANRFSPSGWFNYDATHKIITVDSKCKEVAPHSGDHCFKIHWDGRAGADGWKWAGVMWLEPEDIWARGGKSPTHNGFDLRGANYLSFWARTDSKNQGLQIKTYFGNDWDSCGQTAPVWRSPALTTSWKQYIIPVPDKDMSNVTGGLAVIFNDEHDPDPDECTIYLDDIKFDKF